MATLFSSTRFAAGLILMFSLWSALAQAKNTVTIGIGTQNTTTNTVTGGIVIKELKLLEKYLPKTGNYSNIDFSSPSSARFFQSC